MLEVNPLAGSYLCKVALAVEARATLWISLSVSEIVSSWISRFHKKHRRHIGTVSFFEIRDPVLLSRTIGGIVCGIPRAASAIPFSESITSGEESYVWIYPTGPNRGQAIEPLYHSVPQATMRDADLYKLLAVTDALRMGRAREREPAIQELNKYLEQYARQQRKKISVSPTLWKNPETKSFSRAV